MKFKLIFHIFIIISLFGCTHSIKQQNRENLSGTPLTFEKPLGFNISTKSKSAYSIKQRDHIKITFVEVSSPKKPEYSIEISEVTDYKTMSAYTSDLERFYRLKKVPLKIYDKPAIEFNYVTKIHALMVSGGTTNIYQNHVFLIQGSKNLYKCSVKTNLTELMELQKTTKKVCGSIQIN